MKLDFSKYATKSDLHHNLLKKGDLDNLKSEVDKLDIDKLSELDVDKLKHVTCSCSMFMFKLHVPADLSKLSDVIKNDVVKKNDNNAKIKNI